jgi:tRNA (adenine58-N1)-methyltransferase non-catalytic subunit
MSLIIASEYDPFSIVERLEPYLKGSASIVVQSPYPQVRPPLGYMVS